LETPLIKLTPPQKIISADLNRFRVVVAGRRFGKSYLSINEIAKFARKPNQKCLYVAPTYRQAKTVIWDDLKEKLYAVNWVLKVNESDLSIVLVNGSKISIRSSDNKDALRGAKYNFIVLDECADMDSDTFFTVLRPTLSDTKGSAMFIGSPKGRNWFYDLWVQAGATDDWSAHQYTTIAGGQVDEEEIESARRDMDERQFQQEYLASFVDYAGVIYYSFAEDNIVQFDVSKLSARDPIHVGIDMNINPMSAVICHIGKTGTMHVIDEIEIYSSNTNELVNEIKQRYPHRQIVAYPDASGQARKTSAAGITDHIILQNAGFKVKVGNKNPPVIDRINSVNSMLCNNMNERNLLIDPSCKRLRECLIKHTYREGTRQPNKTDGYDHLLDSLGYAVYTNFVIRKEIRREDVYKSNRYSGGRNTR
tara:strand:- start:159 stop:1424 length:1266 start_codon:yes stop_codon:yes gene_type:complete